MNIKEELTDKMAENLPVLRKKAKLTQTQLAEIIGVSKYTLLMIEKKQRKMSWNVFLSLILVFSKNKETDKMLTLFEIYTDELNNIIKNKEEEDYERKL